MPVVKIGADATTGVPGDKFLVNLKMTTEGASTPFVVSIPTPAGISEMRYLYTLPSGATSLLPLTTLERVGGVTDTITVPANKEATITLIGRSSRVAALGTSISFVATVNGTAYTQVVKLLADNFIGQRGFLNINEVVSVLGGTADRANPARLKSGMNSLQDYANQGLRLWHVFDDLYERRGLPTDTDLTGGLVHAPASLTWTNLTVSGGGMTSDTVVPLAAAKTPSGTLLRGRIILPVGMALSNQTVFATLPVELRPGRPSVVNAPTMQASGTTVGPLPYEPNVPTWGGNFDSIFVDTDGTMKRKSSNGFTLTSLFAVYFDGILLTS